MALSHALCNQPLSTVVYAFIMGLQRALGTVTDLFIQTSASINTEPKQSEIKRVLGSSESVRCLMYSWKGYTYMGGLAGKHTLLASY